MPPHTRLQASVRQNIAPLSDHNPSSIWNNKLVCRPPTRTIHTSSGISTSKWQYSWPHRHPKWGTPRMSNRHDPIRPLPPHSPENPWESIIWHPNRTPSTLPVIAYADDVTVFISKPENFTISQVIRQYEMASGAQRNPHNSKAMAIGSWETPVL